MLPKTSTLALLFGLMIAGQTQAVDLRLYQPANNCSGAFYTCFNLPLGACCSMTVWPFGSQSIANAGSAIGHTAFANQACQGPSTSSLPGFCASASFALWSGRWTGLVGRESGAQGVSNSTEPEKCVEPDGFGYTDKDGKTVVGKIPAGKRQEVLDAVRRGDVNKIKSLL